MGDRGFGIVQSAARHDDAHIEAQDEQMRPCQQDLRDWFVPQTSLVGALILDPAMQSVHFSSTAGRGCGTRIRARRRRIRSGPAKISAIRTAWTARKVRRKSPFSGNSPAKPPPARHAKAKPSLAMPDHSRCRRSQASASPLVWVNCQRSSNPPSKSRPGTAKVGPVSCPGPSCSEAPASKLTWLRWRYPAVPSGAAHAAGGR